MELLKCESIKNYNISLAGKETVTCLLTRQEAKTDLELMFIICTQKRKVIYIKRVKSVFSSLFSVLKEKGWEGIVKEEIVYEKLRSYQIIINRVTYAIFSSKMRLIY